MIGDSGEGRGWRREHRGRPPVRRAVTILCLPGAGGPNLAEELRTVLAAGPVAVRLVVAVPVADCMPVLIGDPLSGVLWPFAFPTGDQQGARREGLRRARRLSWLLWEMGVEAEIAVVDGNPLPVLAADAVEHPADVTIVAASTARRWHATIRELCRSASRLGLTPSVALDTPLKSTRRFAEAVGG